MIELGKTNHMKVTRKVDFGVYLDGGKVGDILLPKRYVPKGLKIGDEIDVFVYLDQEERPVATTEKPLAQVGDFAYLEVAWINEFGAFLNWGLMKDVFCPFREQKMRMEVGRSYIVHLHIDEDSYRIMASAKVEKYLAQIKDERLKIKDERLKIKDERLKIKDEGLKIKDESGRELKTNDEVSLLVWQKTDLGFKVIVDNKYAGLIYDDQIFRELHTGDRVKGYVQSIRPDGKLDISLQKSGREQTLDFSERLHEYLFRHDGYCPFTDKSPAEDIYNEFHVSKKVFKRAVGDLYKQHLITLAPDGIELKSMYNLP